MKMLKQKIIFLNLEQNIAEAVEFLNEESFELLRAFEECRIAMVVVATVVENLRHVFDEVSQAGILAAHYFYFNLFEI